MAYKYSTCVILRNGFIDTHNSFLNQEEKSFELIEKYLEDYIFEDKDLAKLIQDFKNDTKLQAGLWLDYQDYNLPITIEKIFMTKKMKL